MPRPTFPGPRQTRLLDLRLAADTLRLATKLRGGPVEGARAMRALLEREQLYIEGQGPRKVVQAGGRTWWRMLFPGWPSPAFSRWAEAQFRSGLPDDLRRDYLMMVVLSFTRRCALHCAHCYAEDELADHDEVGIDQWIDLVQRMQARGLVQLHLTGGEPLQRYEDLLTLLEAMDPSTELWLNSSGVGLTEERAGALAEAGMDVAMVSLDHWRPEAHDAMRGVHGAFGWVERASRAATDAGMVLALSLCPTRDFTTADDLERYADLAEELGAAFIRVLEPRASGRWRGQPVALSREQEALLEAWQLRSNSDPDLRTRPVITNHNLLARRMGCMAGGDLAFYIDAGGYAHACPFCRHPVADLLHGDLEEGIAALRRRGCGHGPSAGVHPAEARMPEVAASPTQEAHHGLHT